jgi:hypothetical protein
VEIDTDICLYYPIGGQITLITEEGEEISIRFGPDCSGDYDLDVIPAWDFSYRFGHPGTPQAATHLIQSDNARVMEEPQAVFWMPQVGGTSFTSREAPGDTPPAVLSYRFRFDNPVTAARLRANMPTFHWSYSQGYNYLLGSTDGVNWQILQEVPSPPDVGSPVNVGNYDALLPQSMLGTTELWLRAELYCWGPHAPNGGVYTNTAQFSRFTISSPADRFILEVDCEGGVCGDGL